MVNFFKFDTVKIEMWLHGKGKLSPPLPSLPIAYSIMYVVEHKYIVLLLWSIPHC